jgi:hypothetical protein
MNYFYPLIIVFGCLTSLSDIRQRKIRNTHIAWGGLAGFGLYAAMILTGRLHLDLFFFAANMTLAAAIGYGLYAAQFWSAGDGKCFILFSLFTAGAGQVPVFFFPCIFLFVNIMLLAFCAIFLFDFKFVLVRFKNDWKTLILDLGKRFFISLLIVFSISWVARSLRQPFENFSPFLSVAVFYVFYAGIYRLIKKMMRKRILLAIFFGAGLAFHLMLRPEDLLTFPRLMSYLLTTLNFSVFFSFFQVFQYLRFHWT